MHKLLEDLCVVAFNTKKKTQYDAWTLLYFCLIILLNGKPMKWPCKQKSNRLTNEFKYLFYVIESNWMPESWKCWVRGLWASVFFLLRKRLQFSMSRQTEFFRTLDRVGCANCGSIQYYFFISQCVNCQNIDDRFISWTLIGHVYRECIINDNSAYNASFVSHKIYMKIKWSRFVVREHTRKKNDWRQIMKWSQ